VKVVRVGEAYFDCSGAFSTVLIHVGTCLVLLLNKQRNRICLVLSLYVVLYVIHIVVCITYYCNGKKNTIFVASVYMPVDSRLPPMPMEELHKYAEDTRIPAIVASDMNAHHHAWGSDDCNQRGYNLCEFITATNWEIINVGCEPTFCSDGKRLSLMLRLLQAV